jgi:hypothetical protein
MKAIISIILIAASIAFFIFFTKPKWAELKLNKLEVEKLNIAQENAKILKSKIDAILKIKSSISEADLEKIKRMVPDNVENVKLIIDFDSMLQDLIRQKGTAAIYKKANSTESDDFSIENPKISKGNTTIGGDFDSSQLGVADFTFTVSLTYRDFLDFLKRIETSSRIFDIESISFSSPDLKDIKNPDEIIYNFNITLKTYWLKSK